MKNTLPALHIIRLIVAGLFGFFLVRLIFLVPNKTVATVLFVVLTVGGSIYLLILLNEFKKSMREFRRKVRELEELIERYRKQP